MKVSKGLANFYCSIFGDSDHTNIELQMSRADGGWAFVNHSPAPDCLYIPCTDSYLVTDNIIGEAVVNFYNNSNFSGQIIEDPTYPPLNLNINMCMPSVSPCPLGEPSPQASVSPEIYCPSPSPSPLCDDFGIGEGLMFNSATDATTSGTGKASDPVIVDITGNNTASFSGYAVYNVLSSGVVVIDYSVSSEVNDKASIYYNFALVEEIGGTTSSTRVISVNYGDIISLRYEKDGSVDGGTDSAHFEMTFCVT
jgi:hypothetical protein